VIGAIDGCHIDVLAPANDQDSYTDRKINHFIILQVVFCPEIVYLQIVKLKPYSISNFCLQVFVQLPKYLLTFPLVYQDFIMTVVL